jgi:uncharacterized protein (TIGR03435 family)
LSAKRLDSHPRPLQILGGPDWINSATYEIEAKAKGAAPDDQMNGPMLQALLEDRFKLKIHRETREVPVYALTAAKSGLKLKPLKEGSCHPIDQDRPPATAPAPGGAAAAHGGFLDPPGRGAQRPCPQQWVRVDGVNVTVDIHGESIAGLASALSSARLDRPVIDRTGLTGLFDIHLAFALDDAPHDPGSPAPLAITASASIFAALQEQLGLKLSSGTGPIDVLVIDRRKRHCNRKAQATVTARQ